MAQAQKKAVEEVAKKEDKVKVETPKAEVKTVVKKAEATEKKIESKAKTTKGKTDKKEEVKEVKKKKYIAKVKKENKKKSMEALAAQKTLKGKKKLPTFRGRFGKKNIRKKSNKKWQKWRKPRSIDLDRGLQHGFRPKIGYRNQADLRDIHPSGYIEVMVRNPKEVEVVNAKTEAIRISATVGKRKRNDIVTKANEKGIWVLN